MGHEPVLLDEALGFLNLRDGGVYVDGTLGLGGHARELLKRAGPQARLIGIEWDPATLDRAKETLEPVADRVTLVEENFAELPRVLRGLGRERVDGILLDLGLSSFQLEDLSRGFSFQGDGPLDMRMSPRTGRTAADLLNTLGERELARLFHEGGEEAGARRLARALGSLRREGQRIERTLELVDVVQRLRRGRFRPGRRRHPATRVFQALRIAVNGELANLKIILDVFDNCLQPGGRMAVISFHSLEDRLVKRAFLERQRGGNVRIVTPKPVCPSENEIGRNPRSRSAKLRVAEKVG